MKIAGNNHAQALLILDHRWSDGGLEKDAGDEAKLLCLAKWPVELSVNAYNSHFNVALTRASAICSIGQNPIDDNDASILLRSAWCGMLSRPLLSTRHTVR